jgi:hypothetical protein
VGTGFRITSSAEYESVSSPHLLKPGPAGLFHARHPGIRLAAYAGRTDIE